jgi:predicted porin
VQAGASYIVGIVKLYGQYQYVHNSIASGDVHVNVGQIGAEVRLGMGRILASDAFSKSGGRGHAVRNTWAVAYDYQLSKRTDIYGAVLGDRATNLSSGDTVGVGIRTLF